MEIRHLPDHFGHGVALGGTVQLAIKHDVADTGHTHPSRISVYGDYITSRGAWETGCAAATGTAALLAFRLDPAPPHRRKLAVDRIHRKRLRIVIGAQPIQRLPVLAVFRVADGTQHFVVPPHAAAVVGRTVTFAGHADRIRLPRLGRQHFLDGNPVLPTVAEVVGVE